MDITIQNVRSPALEHNERYYKVFQPRTRDELLKLHHMGCVGDTVLTDIQLEQGDFPTSFVEPTVTQRTLSGLFKDMRSIELELRDPNSTLWGKIQQNNQGALTQFFDTNIKSAIAQTAREIRQEVRDAANSARVQVTPEGVTIGATTLTGKQLASTISTSAEGIDLIAPKIRVQSDMIVDGSITGPKMAFGSITGDHVKAGAITGDKISVDDALINNLTTKNALIEGIISKQAFIDYLNSAIIDADRVVGGSLNAKNGAMKIDLNKGQYEVYTDKAAIRRVVPGFPNQFLKFSTGHQETANGFMDSSTTTIGSILDNSENPNSNKFSGITIWNNTIQRSTNVVGDTMEISNIGYGNKRTGWIFTADIAPSISPIGIKEDPSTASITHIFAGDFYFINKRGEKISLLEIIKLFIENFNTIADKKGKLYTDFPELN